MAESTIYSDAPTPSADFASNDSARQLLGVLRGRARLVSRAREYLVGSRPCASRCPHRLPAPFLGLWRECVRDTKGNRSVSPQVVRRKRPLSRPFPGKRRERPLTAGGGARNISPCAADGRKRRGGALGAPGTLKTGYRGKRIGTRAGPPPARMPAEISDERPIPLRGPTQGPGPSFRWLFLYFYLNFRRPPRGRPNEEFDPGSG